MVSYFYSKKLVLLWEIRNNGRYKDHSNLSLRPVYFGVKTPVHQELQYVPTTWWSTAPPTVSIACNAISDSYIITLLSSVGPQNKLNTLAGNNYAEIATHCGNLVSDSLDIVHLPIELQPGYTMAVALRTLEYEHTVFWLFQSEYGPPYSELFGEYTFQTRREEGLVN